MKGKPKKKPLFVERMEIKCTVSMKNKVHKRLEQLEIKQSDYIRMLIDQDLKEVDNID